MASFDLGIVAKPDETTQAVAEELGYQTAGFVTEVRGHVAKQHASRAPSVLTSRAAQHDRVVLHGSGRRPLHRLSRLTLTVDSTDQLRDVNEGNQVMLSYDLVAVVPHTEDAFERCCNPPVVNAIDLISLPMDARVPYALNPALLRKAARAGVHFEIRYAFALRDSMTRRHLIANALQLTRAAPESSIVISSGAESDAKLRAPLDVAHLATLFHMSVRQARRCMSAHARAVVARAAARHERLVTLA